MNYMQDYTKWCWEKIYIYIIVPTHIIVHPCLDEITVADVEQIPKNLCNRNQERKALQRRSIRITDSDHDFIIDEIKHRYNI